MLPGFEIIGREEKKAVSRIFEEGKVFFAHGFDNKRKHFHGASHIVSKNIKELQLHCSMP